MSRRRKSMRTWTCPPGWTLDPPTPKWMRSSGRIHKWRKVLIFVSDIKRKIAYIFSIYLKLRWVKARKVKQVINVPMCAVL